MSLKIMATIMAGGSGERFWPLSRQKKPKQLLCLTDKEKTMLDEAVEWLLPLTPADHIYVATNKTLQPVIQKISHKFLHQMYLVNLLRETRPVVSFMQPLTH